MEKLNRSPDDEVIPAHQLAVALAGMTNSLIKQITALRNYGLYLKGISRSDEAKKQLDKAKEIQAENNITDLEEVEPDSQDLLGDEDDDIDLDKLSDEEDSDDEAAEKNAGGKTSFRVRLNEVGETQLHLVAKRGDLKAVRRFIRQVSHQNHDIILNTQRSFQVYLIYVRFIKGAPNKCKRQRWLDPTSRSL